MAILNVPLADVKNVVYNSPMQGQLTPDIVKFGTKATWSRPCKLTLLPLPVGVRYVTVNKIYTGSSVSVGSYVPDFSGSVQTVTAYYGDILSFEMEEELNYGYPTISPADFSQVTGDVTLSVVAGAYTPTWRTLYNSATSLNVYTTEDKVLAGVRANVKTEATFSGYISYPGWDECGNPSSSSYTISHRNNVISENGVYSGDGASFGFTMTMKEGKIGLTAYCSGFLGAGVFITKIRQLY